MHIPQKNVVYDMGGNGVTRFCLVDDVEGINTEQGVYYIDLAKRTEYTYDDATGLLKITNADIVWEQRKYVHPIQTTALTTNPALGQNYGWTD